LHGPQQSFDVDIAVHDHSPLVRRHDLNPTAVLYHQRRSLP
jgi:hypothetical protein